MAPRSYSQHGSGHSENGRASRRGSLLELLTFDRLIAGRLIHLIYWAGLAVIAMIAFTAVGAAVGLALKEPGNWQSYALALPTLVAGLLIAAALTLLWRAFCEFYVIVFRISDDLRALRLASDAEHAMRTRSQG